MIRGVTVVAAALCLSLAGCAGTPSGIAVTGTVADTTSLVVAPTQTVPAVSLDAGFSELTGNTDPATGRTGARTSTVAVTFGLGTMVRLGEVVVAEGDSVRAGQVVATTDTGTQQAALAAAKADAAAAAAQVGLLADAIDSSFDKQADLRDARAEVEDAIDSVRATRATLLRTRAKLRKARPQLQAAIAQVRATIATYPPVPPPGFPPLAELRAQSAKLKAKLGKVKAGLAKISRALPKLATGLRKAKAARTRIEDGLDSLSDARGTLGDLKDVAEIQAEAMKIPIRLVRTRLAQGELRSPVDGVVVSVASVGDVLAPGATVAAIRETRPSTVTAWLAPAQLARVCLGDTARITGGWMAAEGLAATITRIDTRAVYPPTSMATDEVHLTRAVEVELTAAEQLPAGLPVGISISGCRPGTAQPETNR